MRGRSAAFSSYKPSESIDSIRRQLLINQVNIMCNESIDPKDDPKDDPTDDSKCRPRRNRCLSHCGPSTLSDRQIIRKMMMKDNLYYFEIIQQTNSQVIEIKEK